MEIEQSHPDAQRFSPMRFGTADRLWLRRRPPESSFGTAVSSGDHRNRYRGIDDSGSSSQFNGCPGRCDYIHNVAADLAILRDQSADLIYSNITLQHMVPSLAEIYIREFFRIARPGGHVIFQVPSRPRSTVWYRIKNAAPIALSNLLWRVRTGNCDAMESYFIPEKRVRYLVEKSSGSVRFVETDQCGPPGWQSRKYFCTRTGPVPA